MGLQGRDRELARLHAAVASRRPVLVVGAAGSGRTALLRAAADALGTPARPVHLLAGLDAVAGVPLAPAAPLLAAVGLGGQPGTDGLLEVYTRVPAALAEQGAVVVVDDVDAADRASGVLLTQLVRAGVPVVVAAREESTLPAGLRAELRDADVAVVELGPLGADDVAAVAEDRLGAVLDIASTGRLLRASEGWPRRVVDLLDAGLEGLAAESAPELDLAASDDAVARCLEVGLRDGLDPAREHATEQRARALAAGHPAAGAWEYAGATLAWLGGRPDVALPLARRAADHLAGSGSVHTGSATTLLDDLLLHRAPEPRAQGAVAAALAHRASSMHDRDPRELGRAAAELDRVGLRGWALHAFRTAAGWHRERGERASARALDAEADRLAGDGVQAWSARPQLRVLSEREHEIAVRAAGRARSREIAADLGLSVRTVDNHLGRIFRKLGVGGREELTELLAE